MKHLPSIEDRVSFLDVKLENLFNSALTQILRCIRKEIDEKERDAEIELISKEGLKHIRTTLTSERRAIGEMILEWAENEKLGGEGKPIFVGANAQERMKTHNTVLTDLQTFIKSEVMNE